MQFASNPGTRLSAKSNEIPPPTSNKEVETQENKNSYKTY